MLEGIEKMGVQHLLSLLFDLLEILQAVRDGPLFLSGGGGVTFFVKKIVRKM